MDGLAVAPAHVTEYPTDEELLEQVMRPYRSKNCVYLKDAVVGAADAGPDDRRLTASCEFEIPESCYIDDTGHFNSVEFNICYNQMAYYLMAKAVKENLVAPFSAWTLDDFWKRQLGDILITDFRSAFRAPLHGRHYRGELEIVEIVQWEGSDVRDPLVVVRTTCRYRDDHGGHAHGEISVAITNPPIPDGR
uniref:(2E)-enoyl-[ACP] glycyltransferase n=1 Tax=Streptomyces sp. MJ635-86F5 TaxID=1321967 RepID=X5IIF0_9ACTN|nr:putative NRPS accessory protein [Streptomyces sp. MJ635-86F5]